MVESLSIREVVARTGLSADTLRHYESAGLIPGEVCRNDLGHRVYDAEDVAWFGICASLRRSGMPIATLREYADLVRAGAGTEADRLQLLLIPEDPPTAKVRNTSRFVAGAHPLQDM